MIRHFITKLQSNKKSFTLFTGNAVITLLNFFTLSFLSHVLQEESYATYRQLQTFTNIGMALGALGFSHAVYYYLNSEKNKELRYGIVNANRFLVLCGGFSACLIMLLLKGFFSRDFSNPEFDGVVTYGFLLIFFQIIQTTDLNILLAQNRYRQYFFSLISSILLKIVLFVYLYYTGSPLEYFVVTLIFTTLYSVVLDFIFIEKSFSERFPFRLRREQVIRQLKYGWPIGLGIFLGMIMINTDRLVISYFIKEERAFAILANGAFEVPVISNFYYSFTLIAMPGMIAAYKAGNIFEMYRQRHEYIKQVAPILFPVVLALIHWSTPLIELLFGEKYTESGPIFAIYSLILLLRFCSHHEIFMVTEKTGYIIRMQLVEILFNVMLMIVLVREWGMMGAPVACIITGYLYMITTAVVSGRITQTPLSKLFPYSFLLRNLFVALAILGLVHLLSDLSGTYRLAWGWVPEMGVYMLIYVLVFNGLRKQGFFG